MKRVLVISYYWPPCGGIGVLRNLKFVKYLRKHGWEPVLFIPKNAHYPYLDEGNFKDVPEDLEFIEQEIREPHQLFKVLSGKKKDAPLNNPVAVRNDQLKAMDKLGIWIRGNLFIPDARALWIKPSVKKLVAYLRDHPVDAIYTDGPPHTNTRIGTLVKQKTGLPWLADFQDPWTQVDYLQRFKLSAWAWKRHARMEQEAFKWADKITTASPRSAEQLEAIGARDADSLYYGYDEDDFKALKRKPKNKFTIVHAGLLGVDRKPDGMFEALTELLKERPELREDLSIQLAGQVDYEVLQAFEKNGLTPYLKHLGIVSRKEALQLITNADVLLLCINKAHNADGRIPAKIFEYVRTGNGILALGPRTSDISDILRQIDFTEVIPYGESEEIKTYLERQYNAFKHPSEKPSLHPQVKEFDVEAITAKLARYLDQISS